MLRTAKAHILTGQIQAAAKVLDEILTVQSDNAEAIRLKKFCDAFSNLQKLIPDYLEKKRKGSPEINNSLNALQKQYENAEAKFKDALFILYGLDGWEALMDILSLGKPDVYKPLKLPEEVFLPADKRTITLSVRSGLYEKLLSRLDFAGMLQQNIKQDDVESTRAVLSVTCYVYFHAKLRGSTEKQAAFELLGNLYKAFEKWKQGMGDLMFNGIPKGAEVVADIKAMDAVSSNVACGTICADKHEGSYNALDSQLERQFERFKIALNIIEERDITEEESDEALVMLGYADSTSSLNELRQTIKKEADISEDIQIFFSIPEGETELFWVGMDYAAGHFNRVGTRIHISLPFIGKREILGAIEVAKHELRHINNNEHAPIQGELAKRIKQAIISDVVNTPARAIKGVMAYLTQKIKDL
jgi:tetratricopeptide (TPR) repeat protein